MEKTTIEWLGNSKMENTCDIQIKWGKDRILENALMGRLLQFCGSII